MQTIIYQGQPVQATLVNYLSGTIPTSTIDADGDEELFRDEAGRYYLRRKLGLLTDYHRDNGEGNIEASGRTHVHRLSINAAILWATTRLNSETLALRNDAASLLMEGRGYQDPHPSHLNVEQRAMVSDPDRFASRARTLEPTVTSGGRTVRLLCPDGSVFADVDCEPDVAAGVQAIADEKRLDFGNAFLGLLRDFFARDGKEAA